MEQAYEQNSYQGINYGPATNMDLETGIRYGVIPHSHVGAAWYEDAEAHYGKPTCPHCSSQAIEYDDEKHEQYSISEYSCSDYACEECEMIFDNEEAYPGEPLSFYYDADGYEAEQTDEVDIFIFKSPYFTYAQFCSPCAPGACYLPSPLDHKADSNKCYCLGHEWFENEKAPYPVYSVETGFRVWRNQQ